MTSRILDTRFSSYDRTPQLLLIGVDHRCAPLALREKVAYGSEDSAAVLGELLAAPEIDEVCLVSTCNRTEAYLLPRDERPAYRLALERVFLSRAPEIEAEGRFYVKHNHEAARHLLEVAGGLQSMVLGEPEILGQVKRAAALAEELGSDGTVLRRLLRTAVGSGRRVRRDTAIGTGAVSFGYAVVELTRNIFQSLEKCSVLMIGAGETARQVARNLLEKGARELVVTNRSPERAEEFCGLFPAARALPFAERHRALADSDVVVATTAAEEPVLFRDDLDRAIVARKSRPLLVADLGVPRNVEPAAGKLANLFLQDIDSLQNLIAHNLKRRREEVPRVEEILERELERFHVWYRGLAAEPLIAELQKRAEAIRQQELAAARKRFPESSHEQLDRLTRSLVRKLLHHPSTQLRDTGGGHDLSRLDIVRQLFQLDGEDDD